MFDALETFLFVEGEDSFNCRFGYFEDASGEVRFSYFLFVFVKFLFIFANRIFKICATFLFKCIASACEQEGSISEHDSSKLYFWHSDEVFGVVLVDFDFDGGGQFGLGRVESHINLHIDESADLEFIGFHEVGRDGRVVRYLLHEDGDASNCALTGLSQDGVEGLADFGVACEHKHEGHGDILDLLLYFSLLESLVHKDRDKTKDEEETLDGRIVVKNLYG